MADPMYKPADEKDIGMGHHYAKDASSELSYKGEETGESASSGKLRRQLKNRHIAMIRYAPSLEFPPSTTD